MTNKDYTALLFIVDESGSMSYIANDMEGAIKTLLKEQQELPGKLTVDYVRFNTTVNYAQKFVAPEDADVSIRPSGVTALYDAIGIGLTEFGRALAALDEDERPGQVIVAIVTDGMENASKEYTQTQVKEMVEHQTDKYGWNVTYLGANQDAVYVAQGLGVAAGSALTWNTTDVATASATLSTYVGATRSGISYSYTDADRQNNA